MSSNDTTEGGQPLVFGVPAIAVAAALRGAGLGEDAVIAVLGRTIARSVEAAGLNPAASAGFTFQVSIAETAAECQLSYQRLFVHPDFIDGVTVVQASQTPDEIGFNSRFHSIEAEFDGIARDLQTASNCIAELRRELYLMARELEAKITEIDARIAAKGKDKDTKEGKETKEGKDTKDTKEKDTKEGKDKEGKDTKDSKDKDHKDHKDGKEQSDKLAGVDKLAQLEKPQLRAEAAGAPVTAPPGTPSGTARTFITLDDRPDVEAAALGEDEKPSAAPAVPKSDDTPSPDPAETAAEPAAPAAAKKALSKKAPSKKAPSKRATAKRPASSKATGAAERPTSPPRRGRGQGSAEPTDD